MSLELSFWLATDAEIQKLAAEPSVLDAFLGDTESVGPGINDRNAELVHFVLNGTEAEVLGALNFIAGNPGDDGVAIGHHDHEADSGLDALMDEAQAALDKGDDAALERVTAKLREALPEETGADAMLAAVTAKLHAAFAAVSDDLVTERVKAFYTAQAIDEDDYDLPCFADMRAILADAVAAKKGIIWAWG